jgi:hypothetical protein
MRARTRDQWTTTLQMMVERRMKIRRIRTVTYSIGNKSKEGSQVAEDEPRHLDEAELEAISELL